MKYRHAIIVPIAIQAACNAAAVQLGIDPEGRLDTLCIPLGVDGSEVITHYGACGCMSEGQRVFLEANQASFPGALWWRWVETGESDGELAASWDGAGIGDVWGWNKSLQESGLSLITPPLN